MNRKDFMKGCLALACGASVITGLAAQYDAEREVPNMTPEEYLSEQEVERIGLEMARQNRLHAQREYSVPRLPYSSVDDTVVFDFHRVLRCGDTVITSGSSTSE